MPIVTNLASSPRGLCAKIADATGQPSPRMIDRVVIPVRASIEVEERFLATEGAKALIECGDLAVGTDKQRKAAAKAREKAQAEAQAEAEALAEAEAARVAEAEAEAQAEADAEAARVAEVEAQALAQAEAERIAAENANPGGE